MHAPDPFTALDLTRAKPHIQIGNVLRDMLLYSDWHTDIHPFAELILKAVFDDCAISRADTFRVAILRHLARELPLRSMKTVAKKGFSPPAYVGRGAGSCPFDATAWARSSDHRYKSCLQGPLAWFDAAAAVGGVQAEIKEIAAAIQGVIDHIYQEVEQFHDEHRPAWETTHE